MALPRRDHHQNPDSWTCTGLPRRMIACAWPMALTPSCSARRALLAGLKFGTIARTNGLRMWRHLPKP